MAKSSNIPCATSGAEPDGRATRTMSPAAKAQAITLEAPSPARVMLAPEISRVDVVL